MFTHSPKVQKTQKGILEMILANHNQDCLRCTRNGNCELQDICSQFNIIGQRFDEVIDESHYDITNPCLIGDLSKCIKCGRCVSMCMDTQGIHALSYSNRSENFKFTTAFNQPMSDTDCVLCGQCSTVCPVGAIVEVDDTAKVIKAINDPKKHVVMACPGGCIGGGGQPVGVTFNLKELRQDAIYAIDNSSAIRKSHENPEIKKIYDDFFGVPLSEKSHHFLHTNYKKQNKVTSESLAK